MHRLKQLGPVLMFVAVLGLCAGLVYYYYSEKPDATLAEKRFEVNLQTISAKQNAKNVDAGYPYSPEKAAELKKMQDLVDSNITRLTRTIDDKIGVQVAYPAPTRPRSDRIVEGLKPVNVEATMKPLTAVTALADQSAIFIEFTFPEPKELTLFEPVRVEVFAGKDAKTIDMTKPIGIIELNPEEPPVKPAATGVVAPVAPVAEAVRVRGTGTGAAPARTGPNKTPAVVLPKFTRTYKDSGLQQKTTYAYALRLVGRFTSTDGKFEPNKKPDGSIAAGPGFKHVAPTDPKKYIPVTPKLAGSTTQLYALPLTEVVTATTPSNFALRLEGIVGTPPKPGQPRDPANPLIRDYAARFEVRAYLVDANEWKNNHIEVKEGDMLTGTVRYKTADGKTENFDYTKELGYKFLEVVLEEDKDAKIKGLQVEVAHLENVKTKQKEVFKKMSNPKERDASLVRMELIWKAQEEAKKKSNEVKKAGMERIRSEAATRAASQPAPDQPAQ